jgi:protein involved in sex pheromone biosynthesis
MKKMIRIDLDGPYYPKPTLFQRVWNGLLIVSLAVVVVAWLTGCASTTTTGGQDLVLDKSIQPMSRNEVVSAIGDCQANNLRAVLMYGKRKVNGYTADVVIDVTCTPKW